MTPTFQPAGLRETKPREYFVRFVFGGIVTAATGAIAHHFGPSIGGLFLAFPAILPASLTLVTEHEGRAEAVNEARGACVGSIGLVAFAVVTRTLAPSLPAAAVLAIATVVWIVVSVGGWALIYGRSAGRPARRPGETFTAGTGTRRGPSSRRRSA